MSPKSLAIFAGGVTAITAGAVFYSIPTVEARAQQDYTPLRCATIQPSQAEMDRIEKFVRQFGEGTDGSVVIPVAVHVIRSSTGAGDVTK